MDVEVRLPIRDDADIITARVEGRRLASTLRFSSSELTGIAAAISEVARNILVDAGWGEVRIGLVEEDGRRGVVILALDEGPANPDSGATPPEDSSALAGVSPGLPSARRLMDEFEIRTEIGKGEVTWMRKWVH